MLLFQPPILLTLVARPICILDLKGITPLEDIQNSGTMHLLPVDVNLPNTVGPIANLASAPSDTDVHCR